MPTVPAARLPIGRFLFLEVPEFSNSNRTLQAICPLAVVLEAYSSKFEMLALAFAKITNLCCKYLGQLF